jgi:mRNA interferase RelE/StbE
MYELRIFKKQEREIKKISRERKLHIIQALREIQDDPYAAGKPLDRELAGKFTYKVGPFRIIYKVNKKDNIIQIIAVGHRSNVYKS